MFRGGEDTQSRLFGGGAGGSPPESPSRRLSTSSSIGSNGAVKVSPGFLIKAAHQKSNIFSTDPLPSEGVGRSGSVSSNGSSNLVPKSPGRLIKESQRRSNIFPQQHVSSNGNGSAYSSAAASTADLSSEPGTPGSKAGSVNGNSGVVISPGRLIKASHQRSNIFPSLAAPTSPAGGVNGGGASGAESSCSRNSSSASSSVDLAIDHDHPTAVAGGTRSFAGFDS